MPINKSAMTSIIRRNLATIKKFYKRTSILCNAGKYEIALDQRKLKTPQGKIFEVDNKPLALAVAAEWDAQKETIDRSNMHLTSLCNTVIDNPNNYTKLDMVTHMVNCLQTDTVLFQSESEELYKLQIDQWDPFIQWFCDRYETNVVKTQSIEAPVVPEQTKQTLTRHLMSYNFNSVYGFMYAVDALKSVILTLATVERVIGIEDAVRLSRLEEEYQISHWGNVEWCHELSKEDLQARLAAAVLFIHLNSYSSISRSKGVANES